MKKLLLSVVTIILCSSAFAQNFVLSGQVRDQQTKLPLQRATVRLYSTSDSTFQKNTITDSTGSFALHELRADSFFLYISYVGYREISQPVRIDTGNVHVDILATPSSSSELATIVITANVSPVTQRGDTLQISADQFKVNRDASAEDLVRKVPGITIENGQVKAQGEVVQRVTLDGRELFGDDATAALRNLPAEIIDKIQIFDRLSDQAQFTGFDDGSASRSINITTRANMRNGQFGRLYGGYGTDNRYQAGGNATILNENRRISLVGNFNNINQQNFSQQDLLGVTSNNQRGGGGGGNFRGGAGGMQRGGGGGGRPGNPGGGGFGSPNNFLVGQQNGINKTNAFGINFSDIWGKKLTVTGSYFFNNTDNSTFQLGSTNYFTGTFLNALDSTISWSNNNNHRLNMRLEYRIDSSNSIIFSPNLSFQSNMSERAVDRDVVLQPGYGFTRTYNKNLTNSARNGNTLGGSLLYRHQFPKRGRTFSINLNTNSNDRTGESYVTTFQRSYLPVGFVDTSSQRFTDQSNNGTQLSTNINYTEPISEKSQIQLTYNPSISKSNSDQQTFGWTASEGKYSQFLDSLSNRFQNKTTAHNAGLSYRWGDRDRQISFGVNYQNTNLQSDQVYPRMLNVNQTFSNFLPNAMIRYKISTRSSVRLFYRSNVNNPSVTQLQNVIDITNAPYFTAGNPNLQPQFMNTMSGQYTFTNTAKGLLLVANIFYQDANKYISNATFTPTKDSVVNGQLLRLGDQLSIPVNLDGYSSIRSFLTFAIPIKPIKTNFNLNGGVSYSNIPGIINNVQTTTKATTYSSGVVLASNINEYIDYNVSYTANFNNVDNVTFPERNNQYYQSDARVQLNLISKAGWLFQNDLTNQFYSGLSEGFNQNYWLWNMSFGKKFLPGQKGELKLSVFDLLKQNQSIQRNVTEAYIQDLQNRVLTQYFMLTFTYNLRNFGTAAQRAANRMGGGM